LIVSGWLMLPDDRGSVRLELGSVRIEGGRIAEIEQGDPIFMPDLGGPSTVVCPGFVDAHVHLPQFGSIGADGLELLDWLDRVVWPAEARWEDPDLAASRTERAIRHLLAFGTTSLAAYTTVHHDSTRAAIRVAHELGIGGVIGQVLMDRGAPDELTRPAAQLLDEAASLRGLGRIRHAITPRFALSCTKELLAGAGALACDLGATIQTHLAETRDECSRVAELFPGRSYTQVYDDAGLLGPRSILGHGIWLTAEDRSLLHARGAKLAHCPTANLFLGAGSMDRSATEQSGVLLALGSDVAGGPDRSMVRVARSMLETARWRGAPPPAPRRCWWQITAGNAEAIGLDDAGSIEPGRSADLVLIEPNIDLGLTDPDDPRDPLAVLLYGWDDRWIARTLVAGRVMYSDAARPGPSPETLPDQGL